MAIINYKASFTPAMPEFHFGISISSDNKLVIDIDRFVYSSFSVEPTGTTTALSVLLGGPTGPLIARAVGKLIQTAIEGRIKQEIEKVSESVDLPSDFGYEVEGVTLEGIRLSTYNGMLMATGTVRTTSGG